MSDLIDRSKLPTIRITVPAGHCEESVKHIVEIVAEGFQTMLESAPAVDAVEVVRCKDCACSAVDAFVKRRFCVRFGEVRPNGAVWGGIGVTDNHFCSYGRRRDGDSE